MSDMEYRIKELGEVVGGGTPSTTNESYWNGNIPWISPKDLTGYNNVYISHGEKFITEEGLKSGTTLLPQNTVLMSSRAPIGYLALAQNEICTNQGFKSIVCDESKIQPLYLYYYLKSNIDYIKQYGNGATFPEISAKALRNIKINVESKLEKQHQIANILFTYDKLIENNNKRILLLEQMAENLYKEWFVRFRFPGYENVEFENGIPKGWKIALLSDVADIVYGYPFDSELFVDKKDNSEGNNIIRIRDILDGKTKTMSTENCDDKYIISKEDILIGMDGIFHMNIWKTDGDKQNQRVVRVTSRCNNLNCIFLYHAIYPQIKELEKTIQGTTVAHLSAKDMRKIKVIIPNDYLLKKSFHYFDYCIKESINLWNQNQLIEKQRDMLLPRLMSGKLEV